MTTELGQQEQHHPVRFSSFRFEPHCIMCTYSFWIDRAQAREAFCRKDPRPLPVPTVELVFESQASQRQLMGDPGVVRRVTRGAVAAGGL